ncbi:MAG: HIT family protein [Lachnospiraceae bacterium]|nr:HIT family protein [Lachnospiraceae bacterium]
MKDNNCIFCKIANGEIPSRTIEENDSLRVVLDVGPATKGHALILPKNHSKNLYDLSEETATEVIRMAKKVALKMKEKLNCDGVNLVQNNEEAAGQTVFHFHMHVIPRFENDGQVIGWKPGQPSAEELDAICDLLK